MKLVVGEAEKYICWVLGISWIYGLVVFHLATINNQITSLILQLIWAFLPTITVLIVSKKTELTWHSLYFKKTSIRSILLTILFPILYLTIILITQIKLDFRTVPNLSLLSLENLALPNLALITLLVLGEEIGWRGYLQEELKSFKPWRKYLAIGFIWYLWHLTFLTNATVGDNLFFLAMMIFGSWGIGQVAESTKSIIASACFHLIIQIMMFNGFIKNGIDGTEKLLILGVSVVLLYVVVKKWEKEELVKKVRT